MNSTSLTLPDVVLPTSSSSVASTPKNVPPPSQVPLSSPVSALPIPPLLNLFTSDTSLMYSLFKLHNRIIVCDYSCALSAEILLHGRIYICNDFVGFYSNIFGIETKRCLPISRIIEVKSRQNLLVLPLLEITIRTRHQGKQQTLLFTSWFGRSRDEAADLINQLCARYKLASSPRLLESNEGDDYESVAGGILYKARSIAASESDETSPRSLPEMSSNEGILDTARRNADELAVEELTEAHLRNQSQLNPGFSPLFESLDSRPIPPIDSSLWQRLEEMNLVIDITLPVSVHVFSSLFIDDKVSFSLDKAHERFSSCRDIVISPWEVTIRTNREEEKINESNSLVEGVAETSFDEVELLQERDDDDSYKSSISRTLRMIMPVNGGPLVVKETSVEIVQRLMKFNTDEKLMLVIDSSATSFDVPCGDAFVTEETWLLVPPSIEIPFMTTTNSTTFSTSSPIQICRLIVFAKLNFSKDVWLKDVITTKTIDATRTFMKLYSKAMIDHVNEMRVNKEEKTKSVKNKERRDSSRPLLNTEKVLLSLSRDEVAPQNMLGQEKVQSLNSKKSPPQLLHLLSPSRIKTVSRVELEAMYTLIYELKETIDNKKQEEKILNSSRLWSQSNVIIISLIIFIVLLLFLVLFPKTDAYVDKALERILERLLVAREKRNT
jgi:hypothetical protein